MNRFQLLLVVALTSSSAFAQDLPEGFDRLFNGRDLSGWRGRPHLDPRKERAFTDLKRAEEEAKWKKDVQAHWSVEDGELVNDGKGVYLTTAGDYEDFELRLEYKTVPLADSGIYLRGCPQVQIWDTRKDGGKWKHGADKGSGSLWNNQRHPRFPLVHADRPFGQWNHLQIVMVGSRVSVWLNGEKTVDHAIMENFWDRSIPVFRKGPIQLQTHGGEIRFRSVGIRRIGTAEANAWLRGHGGRGFERIFNGKDFAGWSGAVDQYEVSGGAIRCSEGKGGNLYTKKVYANFDARLEFKLPPGGNNGLAIRYPGEGTPAYDGMCELQVLDDGAEKYAKLKPWQFHGSAYTFTAAHRGFQRAVGEWNFQEVRVQGSKIIVELNGTRILETDLAKVKAATERPHPGQHLKSGHFGFAGHGDPVMFRRVEMRVLE